MFTYEGITFDTTQAEAEAKFYSMDEMKIRNTNFLQWLGDNYEVIEVAEEPKIKLTETKLPMGGAQKYNPKFRDMPLADIEAQEQSDLQSYANVGYNIFTFHRSTGTISMRRIDVKTIQDVLDTDMYGML